MAKLSRRSSWRVLPVGVVGIAALAAGAVFQPFGASQASAIPGLSASQAREMKAALIKGHTDADSIRRPQAGREGSPSSADEQYFQQRAYPASDVPADGYPNGLNQYSLVNSPGGAIGWKELGPLTAPNGTLWGSAAAGSISGRATAIAVDPATCSAGNCGTVYLATANGGIFKTTNGGSSWNEVFDRQSTESVGSLTLDPHNANVIYAGTGEPNNAIDNNRGAGIYKSTDGGQKWTNLGYNTFVNRAIANIVVDPSNSNTLYAASYVARSGGSGTTYGSATSNPYLPAVGFYRSTDGGQTWTLSNPTNPIFLSASDGRTGATSLVLASNGTLYLGIYGQGIYSSTNGGQTWTALPNSSETTFDRITLAVAPSNPNVVYAAYSHDIRGSGGMTLYSSTNGGQTWTKPSNTPSACTGQCWYDMPVNVDPTNANTVYVGGMFNYDGTAGTCGTAYPYPKSCNSAIMVSTDAGATWRNLDSPSKGVNIHPDDHAILAAQNGGLYSANDGGLFHSTDGGQTWTSLNNGIGSLQFQGVAVNSNGDVFGGTQDNGSWMLPGGSSTAVHILGGDGGMVAVDPSNPNTVYDEYYGSQLQRFNKADGSQTWLASFWCDYFCFGGGQFYEPMATGVTNPDGTSASQNLFAGTYRLWRSKTGGGVDGNHDGDATNDPSDKTDFVPITPNVGNISTIAVDSANPNIVAFATTTGKIYYTTNALAPVTTDTSCNPFDGTNANNTAYDTSSFCHYVSGITWTRLDQNSSGTKLLPNRSITSLTFATGSGSQLYVTFSGFNENTPGTPGHVFVTSNAGASTGTTWTNIDGTSSDSRLPDLPANSLVYSPKKGQLVVGADYGVFESKDNGATWRRIDWGMANAPVYDLALSPDGGRVYAATHGRGIWSANLP